jgi:hypothetical protein
MKYKSKLLYGNDDIFWPFHSFSPEIPDDIISFLSMKMLESGRSSVQTPLVPLRSVRISASKALASPENIQYLPLKWPLRLIISLSSMSLWNHRAPLLPPSSTQADHAASSLSSCSTSLASSPNPSINGMPHRRGAPPLPLPNGRWLHVLGRLGSFPAKPRAPMSAASASGFRAMPLAASSHLDGQNQPAPASPFLYCKWMFQVF